MNDTVQDWINGLAGHVSFIDTLMKLSARDIVYLAPPLLLVMWFWPAIGRDRALNQRVAAATFFSVVLALGLAAILGHLHYQARPFVSDASTRILIRHSGDNSFPSDHTTVAFAVGGVIVWWRRLLGIVCLTFAALVAFSRVYVGVHWPLDVIAAAAAGLSAGGALALTVPLMELPQRWLSRVLPPFLISSARD